MALALCSIFPQWVTRPPQPVFLAPAGARTPKEDELCRRPSGTDPGEGVAQRRAALRLAASVAAAGCAQRVLEIPDESRCTTTANLAPRSATAAVAPKGLCTAGIAIAWGLEWLAKPQQHGACRLARAAEPPCRLAGERFADVAEPPCTFATWGPAAPPL
jgi:hypothetical protein